MSPGKQELPTFKTQMTSPPDYSRSPGKQELPTFKTQMTSPPDYSRDRVIQSLVFSVMFCISLFVVFFVFFCHCNGRLSSIYGFWLPLWHLQAYDHCDVRPSSINGFSLPLWYLQTILNEFSFSSSFNLCFLEL